MPGKSELLKHAGGAKHKKRLQAYGGELDASQQVIVDLRSDTITKPTRDMRCAMRDAEVGDDAYAEDPTTAELENKVARLLGKESGLFLPSGTMANVVALLTHCWSRGSQVIVGDQSFLNRCMQPGISELGSINQKTIKNQPDGTFNLLELKELLRKPYVNWPVSTVVCVENTHNYMGGRALPMHWLEELYTLCEENDAILHMDGARLINASVALAISPAQITRYCNTSTFCLNKGLGSPCGSILVGSAETLMRACQVRKMLGGAMHQSGIIAAAGNYSIDYYMGRINKDHANARLIAKGNFIC